MAENSGIEWTNHTGGPWLICTEVSPGCVNCYARTLMERRLGPMVRAAYKKAGLVDWETRPIWGDTAPRVLTKGFWKDAHKLNLRAGKEGVRYKMFPSLIDWLDEMPAGIIDQNGVWLERDEVFGRFLQVIRDTPNLDWLLLTKRPESWKTRMTAAMKHNENHGGPQDMHAWMLGWVTGDEIPPHVWMGVTAEDQPRADERVPLLLKIPARIRWLSVEPMVGRVDLRHIHYDGTVEIDALTGDHGVTRPLKGRSAAKIDWVIGGGDSDSDRPMHYDWICLLRDQCIATGTKFFFKQWGDWIPTAAPRTTTPADKRVQWLDGKFVPISAGEAIGLRNYFYEKIGKAAAGHHLDDVEWHQFPE